MKKILLLLLVMGVLTYLGERFSGELHQFNTSTFTTGLELIAKNLPFIIGSNLLFYLLEMLRLSIIGKIFKLHLSLKDSFGAVALNILFAWITPASILGAPAMAYYLYRRGHPLVESISVAFIRSFSIIVVSSLTTIGIYSLNLQGPVENTVLQEKVFQVLAGIGIYISCLIAFSYLPQRLTVKVRLLDKVATQIRHFISHGKLLIVPILLLGLVINFLFVSLIVYLGASYYENLLPFISQAMLFLSYLLLMPTPGASGLAEVGAPMFFSHELPPGIVVSLVTAMRISTIGVQVGVGLIFMLFVFKNKLTLNELQEFKKNSKV